MVRTELNSNSLIPSLRGKGGGKGDRTRRLNVVAPLMSVTRKMTMLTTLAPVRGATKGGG